MSTISNYNTLNYYYIYCNNINKISIHIINIITMTSKLLNYCAAICPVVQTHEACEAVTCYSNTLHHYTVGIPTTNESLCNY